MFRTLSRGHVEVHLENNDHPIIPYGFSGQAGGFVLGKEVIVYQDMVQMHT